MSDGQNEHNKLGVLDLVNDAACEFHAPARTRLSLQRVDRGTQSPVEGRIRQLGEKLSARRLRETKLRIEFCLGLGPREWHFLLGQGVAGCFQISCILERFQFA